MANHAFEKHQGCVKSLNISVSSSPGDTVKRLEKYWDDMVMDVTADIRDTREKEIYRALINQSKYAIKVPECFEKPIPVVPDEADKVHVIRHIPLAVAFGISIFCTLWYMVIPTHVITGWLAFAVLLTLGISLFFSTAPKGPVKVVAFFAKKLLSPKKRVKLGIDLYVRLVAMFIAAAGAFVNFMPVHMSLFRGRLMLLLTAMIALDISLGFVKIQIKKKRQKIADTVTVKMPLNTDAVFKLLEEAAIGIDANAARIAAALPAPAPDRSEIEIIRELSKIQSLDQVHSLLDYYIEKNGITKVEYSPETAHLFNLMPSDETRTLEPTLIKGEDEIIYTGMALVKEEEI